jgi:uncharacterized membrane protein
VTPVDNDDAAERDALLSRYGIKHTLTSQEATRASTRRGIWSVVLAIGAGVLLPVLNFVALIGLTPIGTWSDPDYLTAVAVAQVVNHVIAIAVAITAMVLGLTSIVGALRQHGQPGRAKAIGLGVAGIALSALMCVILVADFAWQISR